MICWLICQKLGSQELVPLLKLCISILHIHIHTHIIGYCIGHRDYDLTSHIAYVVSANFYACVVGQQSKVDSEQQFH